MTYWSSVMLVHWLFTIFMVSTCSLYMYYMKKYNKNTHVRKYRASRGTFSSFYFTESFAVSASMWCVVLSVRYKRNLCPYSALFLWAGAKFFSHWLRHKLRQLNKPLGLLTYSNVFFVFRLEHVFISENPNNVSFLIVNLWD
jgi:hypothetical protein